MYETRRVQHRITSGFINIVAASHYLPAFWAHPDIGGSFPGLVLIHEWWGLTAHIRTQVRRFAELGYYVVAPDLFDGQVAHTADQGMALRQQLGEAGPPRIGAALRALETHHRCNGQMAVVGWQLGGELALHAAMHRTDLKAVVAFYAHPDDYLVLMPADETPILAFYGEHDTTITPETVKRMREALAKSPGRGEVIVYPGATTGFFNEELPTYNPQAAVDAWEKTLEFLDTYLDITASKKDQSLTFDD
jgi:carboxymethylenebutenolidase